MTTDLAPAPAPIEAPVDRPRIFTGIQPSGIVHLGNDLGAIRNYVRLQYEYDAIYCIVDYHALTSTHDPDVLRDAHPRHGRVAARARARSRDRCTLFVQSHRPEHTELAWLLATVTPVSWLERTPTYKEKRETQPDDINHGLLTYPVLQAADIVIYKASLVPVGKDQAAHLELSREIVRAFNNRYGDTFPEPQAVFTEAPTVLGTDGVRKMSKSVGNTIDILAEPDLIRKQVMSMVTDTQRILRTDPGRPEVCNVCQLQRFFGEDYEELWDGERTARTGCVDMKRVLADRIVRHYAAGARALPRAAWRTPARRRDPGGRRGASRSARRRRRWPRSARRWACADAMLNVQPGPRDRRLLTRCSSARASRSPSHRLGLRRACSSSSAT